MIHIYRPYLDSSDFLAALRPGAGRCDFEAAIAARIGTRYAVAFAYGHSGLIASLRALALNDAEIVLPAYTCTVVADAVVASGNRPVFADIDITDFNMSLDAMKSVLTSRTRAIIATHMYGYPADVNAIRDAVGDDRVLIIEDRALGLLPFASGTVGGGGDLGLFSFGPTKHLFTVEGGVMTTDSAELYEKLRAYRDREMSHLPKALWMKRWLRLVRDYFGFVRTLRIAVLPEVRRTVHAVTRSNGGSPNNYDPTATLVARDYATAYADFQARVGLSQLRKLEDILDRRRELAGFYDRELRDIPGLVPAPIVPGANYSQYTIRVAGRDAIDFSRRMRAKGVEVAQIYDRVLPYRKRFRRFAKTSYLNTERVTREVVNLPIHSKVTMTEAQYVVECVHDILLGRIR